MKKDIKSMTAEELEKELSLMGEKPFRAGQIFSWLHEKLAADFSEMTNLSKALRERLSENFFITALEPVEVLSSRLDSTKKYLKLIFSLQSLHLPLSRSHDNIGILS